MDCVFFMFDTDNYNRPYSKWTLTILSSNLKEFPVERFLDEQMKR